MRGHSRLRRHTAAHLHHSQGVLRGLLPATALGYYHARRHGHKDAINPEPFFHRPLVVREPLDILWRVWGDYEKPCVAFAVLPSTVLYRSSAKSREHRDSAKSFGKLCPCLLQKLLADCSPVVALCREQVVNP